MKKHKKALTIVSGVLGVYLLLVLLTLVAGDDGSSPNDTTVPAPVAVKTPPATPKTEVTKPPAPKPIPPPAPRPTPPVHAEASLTPLERCEASPEMRELRAAFGGSKQATREVTEQCEAELGSEDEAACRAVAGGSDSAIAQRGCEEAEEEQRLARICALSEAEAAAYGEDALEVWLASCE